MNWFHRFHAVAAISLIFSALPQASAQQVGQGGGNTGTRGESTRQQTPRTPAQRQMGPIVFISGTVVQADGSSIPSGVVIERVCGDQVRRETTVNSNGNFSFQVGGNSRAANLLPDASEDSSTFPDAWGNANLQMADSLSGTGGASTTNLGNCEIRARVGGYRSSTLSLGGGPLMGQVDVGTIVLHPIAKVSGTLISVTNLMAPKEAQKALERAQKEAHKKNLADAENQLKKAVDIYPNYAAAWFGLGTIYQERQQNQDARAAYERAVTADAMYIRPYIQLARLSGRESKWQEVLDFTDRALTLDPLDFPDGYFLNAVANYNLHHMDASERSALKAEHMDGRHTMPQVHLLLANIREQKQDLSGAIEQLRNYLKFTPASTNTDNVRMRLIALERATKTGAAQSPAAHE